MKKLFALLALLVSLSAVFAAGAANLPYDEQADANADLKQALS